MIRAFFSFIRLDTERLVTPDQSEPRSPMPQLILAKLKDGEIVHFSCAPKTPPKLVIDVDASEAEEIDEIRTEIESRYLHPVDFIAAYGLDTIRRDLQDGVLKRYPTGSSANQAVVAVDMLGRGAKATLNHACNMQKPVNFFEALHEVLAFYPGFDREISPIYRELGQAIFKGSKAADLINNQSDWEQHIVNGGPDRAIVIEGVIQEMFAGNGRFLRTSISDDAIDHIFSDPRMSEVDAYVLSPQLLALANQKGVQFKIDPDRSALAFTNGNVWQYIEAGYDWKVLPVLTEYPSYDHGGTGSLALYIQHSLEPTLAHSSESPVFWDGSRAAHLELPRRIAKAIAAADPASFAEAFAMLSQNEQLACVAEGYVERSFVDMETIPQAGLSRILENDLGL